MSQKMIECIDLVYRYDSEEKVGLAVDNVSFEVKAGEFVVVLGRNGSGKSTLAKHINSLLLPGGGKVYVDGMDTLDLKNTWDIRNTAGMVFQNPDNQIVATIVEEDVALWTRKFRR
jgi:energy-coupling factor transport system ATP-binding protein